VCWQLATDLLPYVQSCANPVIYSFMSHSFRRRVRTGCRHCCRHCRRRRADRRPGRHGDLAADVQYGGVEEHPLEEIADDAAGETPSRRCVSFGSQSAGRRWSSTTGQG